MSQILYQHTQFAPLHLLVSIPGAAMVAWGIVIAPRTPSVGITLVVSGALMVFLAFCFRTLTVIGYDDHLDVRFGPLSVFKTTILYSQIGSVEQSRSRFIDGWGLHRVPGRGWTWNLWGFNCVEMQLQDGSKMRVGSNDAAALMEFLKSKAGAS